MDADLKLLQGEWVVTSLEVDGTAMPASALSNASMVLKGRRFTSEGMGAAYRGTLEIDASRLPKTLVMHFEAGPEKGNTNHGIYELSADQWKLCLATLGGPAPKAFATSHGSGHAFEVLRRASRGGKKVKPSVTDSREPDADFPGLHEAAPELQGEWQMVSCIRGGEPLPSIMLTNGKRVVDGVASTLTFGPQVFMKGLLCKSADQPDGVDLHHTQGASKGKTQLGIYSVRDGGFTHCYAPAGRPRPTEYQSTRDNGATLTVWKRAGS